MLLARYPPVRSGAGLQAQALATELSTLGWRVAVITADLSQGPPGDLESDREVFRIPVARHRLWAYLWGVKAACRVWRLRSRCCVLHVHGANIWALPSMLVARLLGKGVILKMSGSDQDDPASLARERLGRLKLLVFSLAQIVVSIADDLTEAYSKSGQDLGPLTPLPNGVDIDRFRPLTSTDKIVARRHLGLPVRHKVVVFTGVVRRAKGAGLVCSSWPSVLAAVGDAHLVLVGSCAEEPDFVATLKRDLLDEGVRERVTFTEHVADVAPFLNAADLYVFASEREGMPNALLEAMSSGLPCVAVDLPVVRELLENGVSGRLVVNRSPEVLAGAMVQLLQNEGMAAAMGQRARQAVEDNYSLRTIACSYADIYEDLRDGLRGERLRPEAS